MDESYGYEFELDFISCMSQWLVYSLPTDSLFPWA